MRPDTRAWSRPAPGGALALLAVALSGCGPALPPDPLPQVQITFRPRPFAGLFAARKEDGDPPTVRVVVRYGDAAAHDAKASLRGYSAWHHGRQKPSLRLKHRTPPDADPAAAEFVELSRPEDPLALCNWLPDQLARGLGLLHEHSQPVHVWLDGRDAGVYLQSLRPGDELAAASGRARGTFWKGDALGARRGVDLWTSPAAWRRSGADDPAADRALAELLAAVQQPASPQGLRRLGAVFDFERAASAGAVAALVASNHADRAHNHVLFYDPALARLEPLLWDANGFGIHAEPSLPVEVARHPLAERLQADPRFVDRRNERLWQLLAGAGADTALVAAGEAHLQRLLPALANDPEPGELALRRGVFELQPLCGNWLPAARDRFATFVRARHEALLAHFRGAAVAATAAPDDPTQSVVTVYGTVAVAVSHHGGKGIVAPDGRDASRLWPGLSAATFQAPQHRQRDGVGVAAPHPRPAPLCYRIDAPLASLSFRNAFTGEPLTPAAEAPAAVPLRSLHPWTLPGPADADLTLGPGEVVLREVFEVPTGATLRIAAGTRIRLSPGAGIVCRGALQVDGTAAAPVELRHDGPGSVGLACYASPSVALRHLHLVGDAAGAAAFAAPHPALVLHGVTRAELDNCRIEGAAGDGIVVVGGRAVLRDCILQACRGAALAATSGANVFAGGCEIVRAGRGVVASDGAAVQATGGTVRDCLVGVRADRSARGFPGGFVQLDDVACRDNRVGDVDADPFGSIQLADTAARPTPRAAGRLLVAPAATPVR